MRALVKEIIEEIKDGVLPYDHPFKIHEIVRAMHQESIIEMQRYLRWLKKHKPEQFHATINSAGEGGFRPLWISLASMFSTSKSYEMGFDLLEAGALPYLCRDFKVGNTNVFNSAIENDNLMVARLVLFYDPDYEMLTNMDGKIPMLKWLEEIQQLQDREVAEGKRRINLKIKKLLAETAADARAVIRLRREAETAHGLKDYLTAAKAHGQITQIYLKQKTIEEGLPYPVRYTWRHSDLEGKKHLTVNHYRKKAKLHAKIAYGHYGTAYRLLNQKSLKRNQDLEQLRNIADSMVSLAEKMGWCMVRWQYSRLSRYWAALQKERALVATDKAESLESTPLLANSLSQGLFKRKTKTTSETALSSDATAHNSLSKPKIS